MFGSYLETYGKNNQGIGNRALGGGLEASYFYFKYLGLSVDGNAFNEIPGDNVGGTVTGNLILRLPLDDFLPTFHFAPYLFGGARQIYSEQVGLPTSHTRPEKLRWEKAGLLEMSVEALSTVSIRISESSLMRRYNFASTSETI